jgi:hypothetical protein
MDTGGLSMAIRAFEEDGVDGVRRKVEQGAYDPVMHEKAVKWLARRGDPARKAWKAARDTLITTRHIARRTKTTLAMSGISVVLLVLANYMLWRIWGNI